MRESQFSLRNLKLEEMEKWVVTRGFPAYRGRQLFLWLNHKGLSSADDMLNLPAALREQIRKEGNTELLQAVDHDGSVISSTRKVLFRLQDGRYAETVLIFAGDRRTVCVSSQVGCALGCDFCQTGKMGFLRNLSSGEILSQLLYMMRVAAQPVTNVVFMGMGEPFLNFDAVAAACSVMNHEAGMNISARKITVSTAGIIPGIQRFGELTGQYKLAISLNSPFQDERSRIMPISSKYPVDDLLEAVRRYVDSGGKRVTFEYVCLDGLNMTPRHADALVRKLRGLNCKLNLIPFNETDSTYLRPSEKAMADFEERLRSAPFPVMIRWSGGRDSRAACGQLYYQHTTTA